MQLPYRSWLGFRAINPASSVNTVAFVLYEREGSAQRNNQIAGAENPKHTVHPYTQSFVSVARF